MAYYQISPKKCLAAIIKILYLFFMLSCIHLYHFFLVSIQSLQCLHCLFLASEASREVGNLIKRKNLHTPNYKCYFTDTCQIATLHHYVFAFVFAKSVLNRTEPNRPGLICQWNNDLMMSCLILLLVCMLLVNWNYCF